MASSKNRQRALARAKVERQIARRAAAARRRRQVQAGIGAGLAVVLVIVGIVWLAGGFSPSRKKKHGTAATECAWTPQAAGNPDVKDVGTPPTTGIAHSGSQLMTITTNQGVIEAQLDPQKAPCTVASFAYLAGKQFFDNTKCHRLTTQGIYVLQCGDPSGTGRGGPTYRFPDEFLPAAPEPASPSAAPSPNAAPNLYPKGSLAMANSGPDTNGSQFFIVYRDGSALEAKYTLFGTVTQGLDIVEKIVAGGVNPSDPSNPNDGAPKTEVTIQSLTVSPPAAATPPGTGSSGSPSAASTP